MISFWIFMGIGVCGVITYVSFSNPRGNDKDYLYFNEKTSRRLFSSSLKAKSVDEKEVFKTLKDARLKPCFLDADLKSKGEGADAMDDEFDKIVDSANQEAYEFMRNNTDSLGENSVKNILEDEYTFTHFPIVEEPHYVKVKSKKKK